MQALNQISPITVVGRWQNPAGVACTSHGAMPKGLRLTIWLDLMSCATAADALEVQAMAGVLATAFEVHGFDQLPISGLSDSATRRMMARWFPGADRLLALDWQELRHATRDEPRYDEIEDLVGLLTTGVCPTHAGREEVIWVAHALSQASLGDNHLWQDLHLPSRRELSALMSGWFPAIAARNDRDMKWKKFLYKQLCERAELTICRAPSCSVCTDYAHCFGPEDAVLA